MIGDPEVWRHQAASLHHVFDFILWLPSSPYAWPTGIGLALVLSCVVLALVQRFNAQRTRRARLDVLFEEAPDAMLLLDANLEVLEANPAAGRLCRIRSERPVPFAFKQLVRSYGHEELADLCAQADEEGAVLFDLHIDRQNDLVIDLNVKLSSVTFHGEPHYLAILRDISSDRRTYRLLQRFNRQVLDALPIRVAIMSPSGEYLYANDKVAPSAEAREWLRGKTDLEYCNELELHPEVALRRRAHRRRALSTRKQVHFEEQIAMPDGKEREFVHYYAPVFDLDGEVTAIVACAVDVTERNRLKAALQQHEAHSESFARFKNAFLDNVSHEFRTPLTGIIGAAQILREEAGDSTQEFAQIIERNGQRLMSMLDAMLDLAEVQEDALQVNVRVLDMVAQVKQVADKLKDLADEKDIFLRVSATRNEVLVRQDPICLYRVLHSLIGNAVKFTESGGVVVDVDVDADQVHVRVVDSGVGIRNEFMPHLFEAFHQESHGLSRDFQGVGVGLTVVQRLLTRMKGRVTVDSEKGEGSMFTITFENNFLQPSDATDDGYGRPRALVMTASKEAQRLLEYLLHSYFQVDLAADLESTAESAFYRPYDVVLMHVNHINEEGSAEELLARLRSQDNYDRVPVVAMDTRPLPGIREQLLQTGYDGYVSKPFDKMALLNTLGDVLALEQVPA